MSLSTCLTYTTRGNVAVRRTSTPVSMAPAIERVIGALGHARGMVLSSTYESPGRYTQWDIAFASPPLALVAKSRTFRVEALEERGIPLLAAIFAALGRTPEVRALCTDGRAICGHVAKPDKSVPEEERSRQPSIFSVLRAIVDLFRTDADAHLGLYGAFGYDLVFQFEPIVLQHERTARQRDLVLYLPDEITVVDHKRETAVVHRYQFDVELPPARRRSFESAPSLASSVHTRPRERARSSDHAPGEFANTVRLAREAFRRGDLFEVTPSQTFYSDATAPPAEIFRRLRATNPAPYGFFANLGEDEYLIGASPEMYVRVTGDRVETCPIAGTIARGSDALGDADQILRLLASRKDEAELTMCTDVDRNDKARVCKPGSVRILGRRQIEAYTRLFHTVDHIEGHLREGFDALDAFLSHAWAVTVTGAPKPAAMQFIEDHEKSPRAWYAGAVGMIGFDGAMNTGLTLRAIHVKDGAATVRCGATLLFDSDPDEEERETRLKASALLHVLEEFSQEAAARPAKPSLVVPTRVNACKRVLLIDHRDSFVHTLADYFRQIGAAVTTLRSGFPESQFDALAPDLVVLSPGPGSPSDFALADTLCAIVARSLPCFGVCLGLQAMVEYFGGALGQLPDPVHGRASMVRVLPRDRASTEGKRADIFAGLPERLRVGRYHSLFALRDRLPPCLHTRAETEDGVVMAIEHETLPLAAVQFHPESVMSVGEGVGIRLIESVTTALVR